MAEVHYQTAMGERLSDLNQSIVETENGATLPQILVK
jgi:hypothetical protein